jgi:regulator of sigma E protease
MLIIAGIVLFMALVIIHELGHFRAAKKSGVQVLEFWIGIPPKLFTYYTDKSGTEYTINMIPLGGFVRLKWEDPKDEGTFNAPDSFITATFRRKVIILCGGVIMNFITAFVLFSGGFFFGSKPISILPSNATIEQFDTKYITTFDSLMKNNLISGDIKQQAVVIEKVLPDGIAAKAGLQAGDKIVTIASTGVNSLTINRQLKALAGKSFIVWYSSSGSDELRNKEMTCPEDSCMLGILMNTNSNLQVIPYKYGLKDSLYYGWKELVWQSKLSLTTLGNLFGSLLTFDGDKISKQTSGLTGPVGAVKIGEMIYEAWWWIQFLIFWAMISLSLAVFNILPIPALDGGRLLWVIIQKLFRLKPEKYFTIEWYINVFFFVVLMGLGIVILFRDLSKIWGLF